MVIEFEKMGVVVCSRKISDVDTPRGERAPWKNDKVDVLLSK